MANKEYESLKASIATLVGANSDGKNLFLVVEVFDGEHNNRFEPVFPADTKAEEITEYLKSLIEKNPKLSDEIIGMIQKKVFWDKAEEGWYTQTGNEKAVRISDEKDKHTFHKK